MTLFRDRVEAGELLAGAVRQAGIVRPVILGIPRGGVVVSIAVAAALGAEHGVIVARKIGAPRQPELAIGAVTATGGAFIDRQLAALTGADEEYLATQRAAQAAEARRREAIFDSRQRPSLQGRDVVIVDDGVATGATALAAVRSAREAGAARVIFAVPVGPTRTIEWLRQEADEVICLREESDFGAVGAFYVDFHPVPEDEVKRLLDAYPVQPSDV